MCGFLGLFLLMFVLGLGVAIPLYLGFYNGFIIL
jgi:hypothetical protein